MRRFGVSLHKISSRSWSNEGLLTAFRGLSLNCYLLLPSLCLGRPVTKPEEIPEPPGMVSVVSAMGAGAFGALFVAGLGVFGVFKLALYVAGEAGRSLKPENSPERRAAASERF